MTSPVALGPVGDRSLTPTVYGLLDRGALLRPDLATGLDGCALITLADGGFADVRITCTPDAIVVADDALADPPPARRTVDVEIHAALHDLVVVLAAPLARGLPKPTDRRGRAALARIADGRVDFMGKLGLARRLMRLMSVAPDG